MRRVARALLAISIARRGGLESIRVNTPILRETSHIQLVAKSNGLVLFNVSRLLTTTFAVVRARQDTSGVRVYMQFARSPDDQRAGGNKSIRHRRKTACLV